KKEDYIFKYINYEDLVIDDYSPADDIDGYSGATRRDISQYVIDGAAYTCFVLWKKVYGPVRKIVQGLSLQRLNADHIRLLFDSEEVLQQELAITLLSSNINYQKDYFRELLILLKSQNEHLSLKALNSIDGIFDEMEIQMQILNEFDRYSLRIRKEIVWKFYKLGSVESSIVINLLEQFKKELIDTNELTLVYDMITSQSLMTESSVYESLIPLSYHSNLYVRKITSQLLKK